MQLLPRHMEKIARLWQWISRVVMQSCGEMLLPRQSTIDSAGSFMLLWQTSIVLILRFERRAKAPAWRVDSRLLELLRHCAAGTGNSRKSGWVLTCVFRRHDSVGVDEIMHVASLQLCAH